MLLLPSGQRWQISGRPTNTGFNHVAMKHQLASLGRFPFCSHHNTRLRPPVGDKTIQVYNALTSAPLLFASRSRAIFSRREKGMSGLRVNNDGIDSDVEEGNNLGASASAADDPLHATPEAEDDGESENTVIREALETDGIEIRVVLALPVRGSRWEKGLSCTTSYFTFPRSGRNQSSSSLPLFPYAPLLTSALLVDFGFVPLFDGRCTRRPW